MEVDKMKKRNWARLMLLMSLVGSMPLQASTLDQMMTFQISNDTLYIDASELKLPFIQIPGFLVSPLQVPGELLAPFSQERGGYNHAGIDIRAAEGTPVYAIAEGVVTKAAPDSKGVENGGGHMIFVDFGNGIEGRYMHLSGYGVQAGDKVKAGQVIGFTGNTGDSSTPHLHFEYYINGVAMDPAFIFEASGMIGNSVISIENNTLESITTNIVGEANNIESNNNNIADGNMTVSHNKPFFIVQQ